jgi:hypothetical protein
VRFHLEMRSADGRGAPPAEVSFRTRRMTRIVAAMSELDMTIDAGPPPRFPLWAVYGVSDFDSAGQPIGGHAKEYEHALWRILSWHGPTDEEGIPVHKLGSNLGWHVTADECGAALRAFDRWRERGEPTPATFGDELIPFLREAVDLDGFEVH